jgi:transposase
MRCKGAAAQGVTLMLGIDVSKATLAYSLLDGTTHQLLAEGQVPNTPSGIDQLVATAPADHPWVLEPTGVYSQAVVQRGQQGGRTVFLAPPKEAKAFLAALRPRAKTDRLDSQGLAQYALAISLRPFPVKTETVSELEQLLAARKGLSDTLAQLTQQQQVLPYAAEPLAAAIAEVRRQQRVIDARIAALCQEPELAVTQTLRGIPGIGAVTAAALAACFASHSFARPDQFVAYLGLDVRVRDSGQYVSQRALSKRGHPELRRLLYCCAQANLRSRDPDNPFKAQYQREREKGLASTAALNVVARKLARTAWSLATHDTSYDPARVHRHPSHHDAAPPLDNQP